jgi:hypothetical protein
MYIHSSPQTQASPRNISPNQTHPHRWHRHQTAVSQYSIPVDHAPRSKPHSSPHTHTPDKRHQNRSRIPRSTPVITPRLPNRTQKAKTKKPHLPRSSHRTHPPLAPGMVPDPPYRHLSTWEPGAGYTCLLSGVYTLSVMSCLRKHA